MGFFDDVRSGIDDVVESVTGGDDSNSGDDEPSVSVEIDPRTEFEPASSDSSQSESTDGTQDSDSGAQDSDSGVSVSVAPRTRVETEDGSTVVTPDDDTDDSGAVEDDEADFGGSSSGGGGGSSSSGGGSRRTDSGVSVEVSDRVRVEAPDEETAEQIKESIPDEDRDKVTVTRPGDRTPSDSDADSTVEDRLNSTLIGGAGSDDRDRRVVRPDNEVELDQESPQVRQRKQNIERLQQSLADVRDAPSREDVLTQYDDQLSQVRQAPENAVFTVDDQELSRDEYLERLEREREELELQGGLFRVPVRETEDGGTVSKVYTKELAVQSLEQAIFEEQEALEEELFQGTPLDEPDTDREARLQVMEDAGERIRESAEPLSTEDFQNPEFGTSTDVEAFDRQRAISRSNLSPGEIDILQTAGRQSAIEEGIRESSVGAAEYLLSDDQLASLGRFYTGLQEDAEHTPMVQEEIEDPTTPLELSQSISTEDLDVTDYEGNVQLSVEPGDLEIPQDAAIEQGREFTGSVGVGASSIVTDPFFVTQQATAEAQTLTDKPDLIPSVPRRTAAGLGMIAAEARRNPVKFIIEEAGPELVTGTAGGVATATGTQTVTESPNIQIDVSQIGTDRATTTDIAGFDTTDAARYQNIDSIGETISRVEEGETFSYSIDPGLQARARIEGKDAPRTFIGEVESTAVTDEAGTTTGSGRADLVETTEQRRPVPVQTYDSRVGIGTGEETLEVIEPLNEPSSQAFDFEAEGQTGFTQRDVLREDTETGEQTIRERSIENVEGQVGGTEFEGIQEVRSIRYPEGITESRAVAETRTADSRAETGNRGFQFESDAIEDPIEFIRDFTGEDRTLDDLTPAELRQLRQDARELFGTEFSEFMNRIEEQSGVNDVYSDLDDFVNQDSGGESGQTAGTTETQPDVTRTGVGTDRIANQEVFRESVRRNVEEDVSTTSTETTPTADLGTTLPALSVPTVDTDVGEALDSENPLADDVREQPVQQPSEIQSQTTGVIEDTAQEMETVQTQNPPQFTQPQLVQPRPEPERTRTRRTPLDFDFGDSDDKSQPSGQDDFMDRGEFGEYSPSLSANIFGITAASEDVEQDELSGLEIRPILIDTDEATVKDPLADDRV